MTKKCNTCGELKPLSKFSRDRSKPDGRQSRCKACEAVQGAAWRAANREKARARDAARRAANPEKERARNAAWNKANPEKARARCVVCRFGPATPPWYPSEKAAIEERYAHARLIRDMGGSCEVDHVIPLSHPQVSGLHTLANLQLITSEANKTKQNTFDPDAHHQPNHRRPKYGSE